MSTVKGIVDMIFRNKLILVTQIILQLNDPALGLSSCNDDIDCGWNSACVSSHCECQSTFRLASNQVDCIDSSCAVKNCLQCSDDKDQCLRCLDFLEEKSGRCQKNCGGHYVYKVQGPQLGRICKGPIVNDATATLNIVVTSCVCVGIVLIAIATTLYYWRLKNMQHEFAFVIEKGIRSLQIKEMETGQTKQLFGYDNQAFEPDYHIHQGSAVWEIKQRLLSLRPDVDVLLTMLNEAHHKLNRLPSNHKNIYLYKNVIHELSRVVSLLDEDLDSVKLPHDAKALLDWTNVVMEEYTATAMLKKKTELDKEQCDELAMNNNFEHELACITDINGSVASGVDQPPDSSTEIVHV